MRAITLAIIFHAFLIEYYYLDYNKLPNNKTAITMFLVGIACLICVVLGK